MKITIHRGINQIGGCITEIATATTKILIDLGHNLPKGDMPAEDEHASKKAIAVLTKGVAAIFSTHYHGDHLDLFKYTPEGIEQYIGKVAKEVMLVKYKKLANAPVIENVTTDDLKKLEAFKTFKAGNKIKTGDITVTPYFVSHSAYDAYMLVIEADGKRILHTGDFRDHGYLGKGLMKILRAVIVKKGIDVLITEGTMLSRMDERVQHENDLKIKAKELMKRYKNVFVMTSSTDLERLATFHSAYFKTKSNAPFVCDYYQKEVLKIFSETAGKESALFDFFRKKDIFDFHENNQKLIDWMVNAGCCMLVRATEKFEKYWEILKPQLNMQETVLIFSMWGDYINPNSPHAKKRFLDFVAQFPNIEKLHTSGHASADCLAEVCQLVNPAAGIIPIHSECSDDFKKIPINDELKEKVITSSTTIQGIEIEINTPENAPRFSNCSA
jgi:ribonuclease J